jgi:hypothetical protein
MFFLLTPDSGGNDPMSDQTTNPTGESTDPDSHRTLAERQTHQMNIETARKAVEAAAAELARAKAAAKAAS